MEITSDSRFDARFDFDFASSLLLDIAQERSLDGLLEKTISAVMTRREIARVRIWLIQKGDICSRCPQRPECPDQTRCLHLIADGENPIRSGTRGPSHFYHSEERIPLGVGWIGRIAVTGQLVDWEDLDKDPRELSEVEWLQLERVLGCAGTAISFRGEILGVIAVFSRLNASRDRRAWLQIFADHIGAAVANSRAFEEIRVAGKRLEQTNQRLEQELAERKVAEEKLRKSEQRYRRIVDTASEGIWELDERYVTTLVNRRIADMLGYEPEEMVGKSLGEFLFGDDLALLPARIAARRQGQNERYEQRYRRKDGSTLWMYVSATSMFDAEHRFLGSFAMLMDITERKMAEDELRKHRDYLEERTAELQASNQALRESEEKTLHAFEEIQKLKAVLEQQNAFLKEEVIEAKAFGDLVGQSAALRQISSQIDLVAPTDASVLILGETGTGKELVAHEIHRRSRRKDKPFVRVNCASIPKDLYESEFFGHARGSFTGAIKDRAGRFEAAEGGTIFLDEIGEVPLDLQSKLLRVLQEKSYERVGEDHTRRADVRIIAATNRDLKSEAAAGRFREDFYYRLNVFPIQVAPLRERREDIPLLAQHFIKFSVKEMGCAKPRLTRAAIAKLENYHWPGNIRELRNVIERAIIISRGGALDFDLPVTESAEVPSRETAHAKSDAGPEFLTEAELQRRERKNLLAILEKTRWKIKGADGAAELLGVKPTTLKARIKKIGLKRPG